mmetsp:Transcript_5044/g.18842  ORF Transcript_5044/g.18842 Transcript_5044/m.18842 type:complete len:215 (-) Transcript_5044:632-1276(-)
MGAGGAAPACPGRGRFCFNFCPAHVVAALEFSFLVSLYSGRFLHVPITGVGAPFSSSQYTSNPPSPALCDSPDADAAAEAAAPRMPLPRFALPALDDGAPNTPATPPPTAPRTTPGPGFSASWTRPAPAPPRASPNFRARSCSAKPNSSVSSNTPPASRSSCFRCSRRIMRCVNCSSFSFKRSRGAARITTPRSYTCAARVYAPLISRNAAYAS